jgi:peptidoglycan/LPS O-acetylase OafA/YrhL
MDGEREQLRPLTGTRFVAAMLVVLLHAEITIGFLPRLPVKSIGYIVLVHSHLSVDYFFLLSGFILSYSYYAEAGSMRGSINNFLVARFARIYPVYALGLVLGLMPLLAKHLDAPALIRIGIMTPLLLHAWVPASTLLWNVPSWSLSDEALFYLLFPLILTPLTFCRRHILILVGLLSWWAIGLVPVVFILIATNGLQSGLSFARWEALNYNPLLNLPEFVLGVVAGVSFARTKRTWHLPAPDFLLLLLILSIYLILNTSPLTDAPPAKMLVILPFLLIIVILAYSQGVIAALLGSKLFVALGEISYGIYILHWPVWDWLAFFGITRIFSGWSLLFPYLTILLTISALSYYFIERPLRRKICSVWAHRQQRAKDVQARAAYASVGERRRVN